MSGLPIIVWCDSVLSGSSPQSAPTHTWISNLLDQYLTSLQPKETAIEFAQRVKADICKNGGLVDLPW